MCLRQISFFRWVFGRFPSSDGSSAESEHDTFGTLIFRATTLIYKLLLMKQVVEVILKFLLRGTRLQGSFHVDDLKRKFSLLLWCRKGCHL